MEINHYGDTILGAVPVADIVEGRMVVLTGHTFNHDFGSYTDLPGCKVPDNATEAARARYVITWASDNRPTPLFQPQPALSFALRGGFDQASNVPFAATVYLTHPAQQEGLTIPSGSPSALYGEGIYTVPSGAYVYDAGLTVPGAPLAVANVADDTTDAGKLKSSNTNPVAEVVRYESTSGKLTFKILH